MLAGGHCSDEPLYPPISSQKRTRRSRIPAKAEYGAQFRDDLADFVTRETVEAVTCWGRKELPPLPGVEYAAFCDPSGGISDAMTLAIGHLQSDATCVLDSMLELKPPFDPERAVRECAAQCRRYRISKVTGDRYAGMWPVARLGSMGSPLSNQPGPSLIFIMTYCRC